MKKILLYCTLLLSSICFSVVSAADTNLQSTVKSSVDEYLKTRFCNCAYLFAEGESKFHKGAQGFFSMSAEKLLIPDQKMPIASATKTMTAAIILRLQHKGKLHVRDSIALHLNKKSGVWNNNKPPKWAHQITIHQLLTHTSGLPEYFMATEPDISKKITDIEKDIARFIAKQNLLFRPGAKHYYCNTNFTMLGLIIESITKKNLSEVFNDEIFKPLGMNDTKLVPLEEAIQSQVDMSNCSHPERYFVTPTGFSPYITPAQSDFLMIPFSDGGVMSSTEDLLKWQQALHGGKVLPKYLYQLMTKKHRQIEGRLVGQKHYVGYGIFIVEMDNGDLIYHHSGNAMAIRSESGYIPAKNLFFIVLSNTMEYIPDKLSGVFDLDKPCNQLDIKYFMKYIIEAIYHKKAKS
ncbi:MAG: hypothetical protein DGJ47_000208 [Rickettsiaceae bacterium]